MDERWDRVQELFVAASDLPREERGRFLDENCGPDTGLRAEVESLLDAEFGAASFVVNAIGRAAVKMAAQQPVAKERMVGAYRILGELGHGGMGAVYLAERADRQFRKSVAIKMARFAGHDHSLWERFRYERQILAGLEHPNIGRLLDGGETEDGVPYLVMEYVEGSAITEFAKARGLDVRGRLELILKVAAAVQYAHQSLIIHRDLKPANILVTETGEPKLLDFGIAKLLEPDLLGVSRTETATGLRLLTPDYASPEQVRGTPVTTSTDIYSLGAVLYEMLTGARPHAIQEYTPLGIDQAVCETPTERPSQAAARTGVYGKNTADLSGDLDVIVLKAMHKEPARRYASVEHFADDIRRFLDGRPILARGDSKWYRAGKFVRRHRIAASAAVMVLITLIAGVLATSWQAYRASAAAHRAEMRFRQVRQLTQRFLFDFDEQIRNLEGSTPARRMVVKTAQEYLDSLASEAGRDAELGRELAIAYRKLGDIQGGPWGASLALSDDALKNYERSVEVGKALIDQGSKDSALLEHMINATRALGLLENRLRKGGNGQYEKRVEASIGLAEALYRERSDERSAALLASVYRERGEMYAHNDEPVAADQNYTKALPLYEQVARARPGLQAERGLSVIYERLADAKVMLGDLERGRELYRAAVDRAVRLAASSEAGQTERRRLMSTRLSLAALLGDPHIPNLGRTQEAVREMREALALSERLAAADPANRTAMLDLAYTEAQFARTLITTRHDEAVVRAKRAVDLTEDVRRASPDDRVYARHLLQYRLDFGSALAAAHRMNEARVQLEQVLAEFAAIKTPGNDHRLIEAEARRELGRLLTASDRVQAQRYVIEALRSAEPYFRQHMQSIESVDDLSQFYEAAGVFDRSYYQAARTLWAEWARMRHSSDYDRRRLKEVEARMN